MFSYINIKRFEGVESYETALGLQNRIAGANGTGKSQLFRSILWCLYGTNQANGTIPLAQSNGWAVQITSTKGTVTRSIVGGKNKLFLDSLPTTQEQINALFGSAQQACCVMFPSAFYYYDEAERRDLLLSIAEKISAESLFNQHFAPRLKDPVKFDWTLPLEKLDAQVKQARANNNRKIESSSDIIAQLQTAVAMRKELEKSLGSGIDEQELLRLEAEENRLIAVIAEMHEYGPHLFAYEVALEKHLQTKTAHLAWQKVQKMRANKGVSIDVLETEKEKLTELLAFHKEIERQYSETEAKGKRLATEIEHAENQTACPTCKREYDNAAQIAETIVSKEAEKATLVELFKKLKKEVETTKKAYVAQQEKYKKLSALAESEAETSKEPLVTLMPEEPTQFRKYGSTSEAVRKLRQESEAQLKEITAKLNQDRGKKLATSSIQIDEHAEQKLAQAKEELLHLQALEADLSVLVEAFHDTKGLPHLIAKASLASIKIEGFDFVFEKTLGNGSVKPCCEVLRSEDGVCVDLLSTGQKAKFGLALAQTIIKRCPNISRSIFVECADVIDKISAPVGVQLSVERVVKDEPLTVEIKKGF
jgi:hypothetical protein